MTDPCYFCSAPGIYHGTLNFDSTSDDLIDGAQLLPYPTFPQQPSVSPSNRSPEAGEIPVSMSLTEYHFLLLYRDRVVGVSTLNEQLTYEDLLPLVCVHILLIQSNKIHLAQKPNETVRGITSDPVRKTYWVYTDQAMYELGTQNEDRDVWKIYLEKGKFEASLKLAKVPTYGLDFSCKDLSIA